MRARRTWLGRTLAPLLTTALAVSAVVVGAPGAQAEASTATAARVAWAPSVARPYSAPTWLPLRRTAAVSCTYSSPGCSGFHSYWAIDLIGQLGDPVYAAGAGVFHIGAVDGSCTSATAPDAAPGTWAWVDHGAGVVSRYHHLDAVIAREGQLVTPSTQIGRIGHSGDFAPCTTNYLHFEVRTGGVKGTRVDPGQLTGCQGTVRRSYPSALGYASWRDVPRSKVWTPSLDGACLPSSTGTATAPASITGSRGNGSAAIGWTAPASGSSAVNGYVVSQELWSPSLSAWNAPVHRTVAASQLAATSTGLVNGRRYRFQVLARSAAGNSAWTRYVEVVPATVPGIPATDRGLTASADAVRFAWWKSTAQGTPVTSYTLAIRRQTSTGWKSWAYVTVPADMLSYKFTRLRAGATYQVTARANSTAGSSRYGAYRAITTART
jgi:peptidase M23-like protein/fibronectin type III domain protein